MNLNTLVSVWWNGEKADCVSVIKSLSGNVIKEPWSFFTKIWSELFELNVQWSSLVFTRIRTYELAFFSSKNVSLNYFHSTVCDNRKIVNFENKVAKLIQMQITSLNIPKSARIYNRSLSFLYSTPDRLRQHSAVRASCEFNYLKERGRKRSRKVTFVVRN